MEALIPFKIRSAVWPNDYPEIEALDDSLTTELIYELQREAFSFRLVETPVTPPLHKTFPPLSEEAERLESIPHKLVAEEADKIVGFVGMDVTWNGWARVWLLRVDADSRRKGVGRALMSRLSDLAQQERALGVWLETQNVNYPAIQFYRRLGFELCGLDETLYKKWGEEVGLYFARMF